jgi:hypothetical protein
MVFGSKLSYIWEASKEVSRYALQARATEQVHMKWMFAFCLMSLCAEERQDLKITYLARQASVQDVARTMAAQAGLGYNWQKSFDQTDPQCRRWVRDVRIEAVPFGTAMQQILDPVGLRYQIENGLVVLYRVPNAIQLGDLEPTAAPPRVANFINYSTDKKSVQYIVIDLAAQVGLGYNWEKSFAQTDPECRRFVYNVSIKDQPFQRAMAKLLAPVGLRYQVEADKVVLYR